MESSGTLASPGHRNGMNGKVKTLISLFSSSQHRSAKRRLRARTEISDFDSMGDDDESADYALMEEEEKLMLKDEHEANRRILSEHETSQLNSMNTIQNQVEKNSSCIPSLNHAIASIEGKKEIKQIETMKKDSTGPGVWLGTRGRKLIGEPLPPPPTILVKKPEVANPIIGGTASCSLQGLEVNGSSTTINTILSFKPSIPNMESVPNPILSSPFQAKESIDLDQAGEEVGKHHHVADVLADSFEKKGKGEKSCATHFNLPPFEESKSNHTEEEITKPGRKYSVSFSITESKDMIQVDSSCLKTSSLPRTRKRIYSIDFDSCGDDMELGKDTTSSAAKIAHVLDAGRGCHLQSLSKSKEETDLMPGVSRDRGLSFELFSFGLNEFDAAPLYTTFEETTIQVNGRPRGDSIIFDPISFIDGGIHEQNALKRARRASISSDVDEVAIMNTPGFLEAPISDCVISSVLSNQLLVIPEAMREDMNGHSKSRKSRTESGMRSRTSKGNTESNHSTPKRRERNCESKEDRRRCKRSTHSPTTSNIMLLNPLSAAPSIPLLPLPALSELEETIQMPHGSLAAAAAALSFYPHLLPVSMNGSVSHSSFPMSLLNKEGRIGIYLPEARKDRIAKFHSKRQKRTWRKRIKYDCRKKLADSRPRVKGRFVKSLDDGE